jgi:endothelin-converting enzyme/putative endopeptidase
MKRLMSVFALVCCPLAAVLTYAQEKTAETAPRSQSGLELSALDKSADACTDFYQYACGGWIANNPIPADRSRWGRFDELQDRNNEILHKVLEQAAANPTGDNQKIGDYYGSCMDEAAINAQGIAQLQPLLTRIDAVKSANDLAPVVAELHTDQVNALFGFGSEADFKDASLEMAIADQGGMGLPERDYYTRIDEKSAALRKQYVAHVGKMLALAGTPEAQATDQAKKVMDIEIALAKGALDVTSRRDPNKIYHKLTPQALQAMTPQFQWQQYFSGIGAPPIYALNVTEPDFFTALGKLLASTPIDDVKIYLRWQLIHSSAMILPTAFVNENFAFYGKTLTGAQELRPRWKRCVQYTDGDLGEALGAAFVKETFGPEAKADTLKVVHEIEGSLSKDIDSLTWMTDTTKREAKVKLQAVADKIGYPDKWRDYSALVIKRGDALGNSQRANAFEFHRQLKKIGNPTDKSEWGMTPPTVNAYYNPLQNNITFPAGILQPPFYSVKNDPAVNYGGVGGVVGHELTHGFDDQGRQFDARGNLKDWWTAQDAKAFTDRAQCFVDQYSNYTAVDDVKLNGKLTLGENAADNGGMRLALMSYLASSAVKPATLDGFSPEQRFFLGFAQVWCESRRPEASRMLAQVDPHSPGRNRVNGVVSNMPEFAKAFNCKADAPMVRQTQCRVW